MSKKILITGATDGIGLATAKALVSQGHHVLLHGRNPSKLKAAESDLSALSKEKVVETYVADLSQKADVEALAHAVAKKHTQLDVLINNAGVYNTSTPVTSDGLDVRFVVNAIAPYLLTQRLLPLLTASARVINLSSAAQSPVNLKALTGQISLSDGVAYAQSKLALTMWSRHLAHSLQENGLTENSPVIVAVNPGSMLGSKMVKQAFGVAGKDINIGAEILARAALSDEFATASGQYFDNDSGQFAPPHPDALNPQKAEEVVRTIETVLTKM
ncbi:MAG: SDR family NAD(P)-dependent oxidoreductase [Cyanobacteria bacterium J06621_11]